MTASKQAASSMFGEPPKKEDVERLFAKVGRVASAFGSLELAFDEFLTELINSTEDRIGHVVLTKMNSFKVKIRLFRKLVLLRCHLDEQPPELKELAAVLETASDRRNDVVHSAYLGIAGEKKKLHQRWPPGRSREKIVDGETKAIDYGHHTMSEGELDSIIDQIEDAEFKLLTFMTERVYGEPNK